MSKTFAPTRTEQVCVHLTPQEKADALAFMEQQGIKNLPDLFRICLLTAQLQSSIRETVYV